MMSPTQMLKESTKKVVELLYEFSKVTGYNTDIQRAIVFLYSSNDKTKVEI